MNFDTHLPLGSIGLQALTYGQESNLTLIIDNDLYVLEHTLITDSLDRAYVENHTLILD